MPELCEKCHSRPALVHIRAAGPNGQLRSYNLCPPCAFSMIAGKDESDGLVQALQDAVKASGLDLSQLLNGEMFAIEQQPPAKEQCCPQCGMKRSKLRERHLLGCIGCLDAFRDQIKEILGDALEEQRHHRRESTLMVSQTPEQLRLEMECSDLRRSFEAAVKGELYEQAAELKKRIEATKQRMLAISRVREHRCDDTMDLEACKAFLSLPQRCSIVDDIYYGQPWLPWESARLWQSNAEKPLIRLSTFVNFSRNLSGAPLTPFKGRNNSDAEAVCNELQRVLLADPLFADAEAIDPAKLDDKERRALATTRWATEEFLSRPYATRMIMSKNHRLVARINYLDHLQILLWGGPEDLPSSVSLMSALERRLQRNLNFASDTEFGSVSRDVHSLGSGVNLGCFLHLPATLIENRAEASARACTELNVRFRPLNHNNDKDNGAVYSIRTDNALGDTLYNKCLLIRRVAAMLERHEMEARACLQGNAAARMQLCDRVGRGVGIATKAWMIDPNEARQLLSLLWFGHELGMLPGLDMQSLFLCYTPAFTPKTYLKAQSTELLKFKLAKIFKMMLKQPEATE